MMIKIIEYRCPKCGSRVDVFQLLSYPPQTQYKCTNPKCDYSHTERWELLILQALNDESIQDRTE